MYPSSLLTLGHSPHNSPDAKSETWLGFPSGRFPSASPVHTPHPPAGPHSPGINAIPAPSRGNNPPRPATQPTGSPFRRGRAGGGERARARAAAGQRPGYWQTGHGVRILRGHRSAGGTPGPAGTGRAARMGPGSETCPVSGSSRRGPKPGGVGGMRSRVGRGGKGGGEEDREWDTRRGDRCRSWGSQRRSSRREL